MVKEEKNFPNGELGGKNSRRYKLLKIRCLKARLEGAQASMTKTMQITASAPLKATKRNKANTTYSSLIAIYL